MKKRILHLILVAMSVFTVSVASVAAQAQPVPTQSTGGSVADNVCKGVLSAETGTFESGATIESCAQDAEDGFGYLVRRIINIFSIVVGAVSVIMIIIGGFRYIISGGDSAGVSSAKNTILYAVVGLVIVLFAQVIIRFILTNAAPLAG
jgi:hypothetical protein